MKSGEPGSNPRVVLDSNVLISGFAFPGGSPYQILRVLLRGDIEAVISPFILEEVERNLRKLRVQDKIVQGALVFLREHCTVIDAQGESHVTTLTTQDNCVLDCAVQGKAQYLVTGDKGILQLKEFQGIKIVNSAEFLDRILVRSTS